MALVKQSGQIPILIDIKVFVKYAKTKSDSNYHGLTYIFTFFMWKSPKQTENIANIIIMKIQFHGIESFFGKSDFFFFSKSFFSEKCKSFNSQKSKFSRKANINLIYKRLKYRQKRVKKKIFSF